MRRLIRHTSNRFAHRLVDYTYPQLRKERPRVSERETHADGGGEELARDDCEKSSLG